VHAVKLGQGLHTLWRWDFAAGAFEHHDEKDALGYRADGMPFTSARTPCVAQVASMLPPHLRTAENRFWMFSQPVAPASSIV
jgi:hypothetical protein